MLLSNKALLVIFICMAIFGLILIFSKCKDIRWITVIVILAYTIIYFSLTFIFDLGKDMYELYHFVDPNFKYSDALNATIAILGLFGTILSITLTYFYKNKSIKTDNSKDK
ncbi:MAG: hypothetical protein ACLUVC_00175 [Longibaculum sp.]